MSEDETPYTPITEKLPGQNGSSSRRYEDDPETQCGIGSIKPEFMQGCAGIGAFVGIYSISGLLTSSLSVYVNSQVSMLEKQFGFSSAETGVLMSCNDIGYLLLVLLCGYFANKCHIPRVLGFSTILFGICGIMCALPYFLQDQSAYEIDPISANVTGAGRRKVPMCDVTNASLREYGCSGSNSAETAFNLEELRVKRLAYWLIAIGMVFQGIGKSVRGPFVTLYIDDAVDKRKTGYYMGIIIGISIFGPACAYLLGGLFSKIYVTLEVVDISPGDPRWIGAWWLGFLVFGACAILFSVPLMCFPRKLRSHSRRVEMEEMADGDVAKEKNGEKKKSVWLTIAEEIKGFFASMIRVFKNPIYSVIAISGCINMFGVAGSMAFMPKYMSSQYDIPLWKANIILALSSITSVSIGSFVGGILSRKINMTPITTTKLLVLFYLGNIACQISGIFLGCDQQTFVGDNSLRTHPDLYTPTNVTCLQGCACNDEKIFPICGDDSVTYYSPCHAGCTDKQGAMGFTNCTCIPGGNARTGLCEQGCTAKIYIYAVLTFIGKFVTALKIIPSFIAKIRCVEERDRAVAAASSHFLSSIVGWMPGPVVFGMLIDNTCLLWKYTCGERQSCQLYDIAYFRTAIHAFGGISSAVGMLGIVGLYIYFRTNNVETWTATTTEPLKDVLDEQEEKEKHALNGKDSKPILSG